MARFRVGQASNIFIKTLSEGCWEPLAQNLILLLNKLEAHTQNNLNPEIQDALFLLSDRILQET